MTYLIGKPLASYYPLLANPPYKRKAALYHPIAKDAILNAFTIAVFIKVLYPCIKNFLQKYPHKSTTKLLSPIHPRSVYRNIVAKPYLNSIMASHFGIEATREFNNYCEEISASHIAALNFLYSGLELIQNREQFNLLIPVPVLPKLISDFTMDTIRFIYSYDQSKAHLRQEMFNTLLDKNPTRLKDLHYLCGLLLWSL